MFINFADLFWGFEGWNLVKGEYKDLDENSPLEDWFDHLLNWEEPDEKEKENNDNTSET